MFAERQEKVKDIITHLNNKSTDEELAFLGFTQDLIDEAQEILGYCGKFKQNLEKNTQFINLIQEIARNGQANVGTKQIIDDILNRVDNLRKGLQQDRCKLDYGFIKTQFPFLLKRMETWNHEHYTLRDLTQEEVIKRDQNNKVIENSVWE